VILIVYEYFPADSETPYCEPFEFILSPQTTVDALYTLVDVITVEGLAGSWRADFEIEDAKGNESNVVSSSYVITE